MLQIVRSHFRQLGTVASVALSIAFVGCNGPSSAGPAPKETTPSSPVSGNAEQAGTGSSAPGWTLTLEGVPSPTSARGVSPQLTVEGDRAMLSWLEPADTRASLKFAERTPAGWSEARVVASGNDIVVNDADVPSVRALADGTLAAHWLQEDGPDPEAYRLPVSWSKDDGRSWTKPVTPNHDKTKTQHGFAALFQAPGAGLGVVWLDGRTTSPEAPEGANGSMNLFAAVYGLDGKQTSEKAIDTRVCDCCQVSAATTSEGVIVAYRDRSADEIRDIYVTRFEGGRWTDPTPVHDDGWKIEGCPVNGPAVSARGRDVAVAWFTAATGQGQAFVAFSHDTGRTFGQPVRVDDAVTRGQVDIELLADGSAAVSWVEIANQRSEFRVRRIEQGGMRSPAVTVANGIGTGYPRLAQGRDELLFAWTEIESGSQRLRTARAPLRGTSGRDTTSASH